MYDRKAFLPVFLCLKVDYTRYSDYTIVPDDFMTIPATAATTCPFCGEGKTYHLEDGRIKCAQCAHKFTPMPRHSHLPEDTIRIIGRRFWEMTTTTSVATELNLNIKTVQRYFLRAREGMARCCEDSAVAHFSSERISRRLFDRDDSHPDFGRQAQPICAIASSLNTLSLLFCTTDGEQGEPRPVAAINGWLYGRTEESIRRHLLDQIHLYVHEGAAAELPRQFWQFAKKGLARYQGGFRHNFPLFLREMEFRFKVRQRPDAADLCAQLLIDHTTCQEY